MTLRIATVISNIEPMTYNEYFNEECEDTNEPGYLIEDIHQDGRFGIEYTGGAAWEPRDKVDDLFRYPTNLCFSHALWFVKHFGSTVSRYGWESGELSITRDKQFMLVRNNIAGIYLLTTKDLLAEDWFVVKNN